MNDVSTTQMARREKNGVNVLMSTHKGEKGHNLAEALESCLDPIERSSGYVSLILRLALVFEWPA